MFGGTGSLANLKIQLERIGNLGANVLWLMPIYPQGTKNAIGSPYCVRDYMGVNPAYGTLEDLKSLVSSAHEKGMKVIFDWVANHTSWDNDWIARHPEWYTQENGQIISPKGMGWNDVADLNYSNLSMRAAMKEAMLYWVNEVGVDGFRCDYTDGVPADFWKDAIDALKAVKGDGLLMLGESSNAAYYDAGFDLLYAWSYAGSLPKLYSGNLSLNNLITTYNTEMSATPVGKNRMRYIINHDTAATDGSPLTLYKSARGAISAFVLSAFLEGVPMIYSSQEVAYPSKVGFFGNVSVDWTSNQEYQDEYARVLNAYKNSADVRGSRPTVANSNGAAIIRYSTSSSGGLLVFINTTGNTMTVKVPMEVSGRNAKDLIEESEAALPASVTLETYGYRIYKLK